MKPMWTKTEIVQYEPEFFEDIYWEFIGTPQYAESVYQVGVIEPIILAKYRNRLELVAGNRRILSYIKAVERAKDDGSYDKRVWLHTIDAKIYHGLNPENQTAISLTENEERSENTVLAFMQIQRLKDENKWDEVATLIKMNKGRLAHFRRLEKVDKVFLEAHTEGKIAKGNLLKIASLNKTRQGVLKKTLKAKEKITYPDIREAKSTQVARALKTMPSLPAMPVPTADDTTEPTPDYYTILNFANKPIIAHQVNVYDNFAEAITLLKDGEKLYKLVEV